MLRDVISQWNQKKKKRMDYCHHHFKCCIVSVQSKLLNALDIFVQHDHD